MASTLSAHSSQVITYEQLAAIQAPPSTRSWRPVAHLELVDLMKLELYDRNMKIEREQYAVNPLGTKLFGTFDLDSTLSNGIGNSLGFRQANDKSLAIHLVGGGRVFVCDNLMLSGDITMMRQKHTWGYSLRSLIQRGLDQWQNKRVNMATSIERMKNTPLSDETARALLAKSLFEGVTTFMVFKKAYDLYFTRAVRQPELYPDCTDRSAWGLHNAFTRALKDESSPNVAFKTNVELGRIFRV